MADQSTPHADGASRPRRVRRTRPSDSPVARAQRARSPENASPAPAETADRPRRDARAGSAPDTDALLEVRGLVKSYRGRRVVDGVSFRVDPGEIFGLLGPNGAGKTTSFRMTVGLVRPDDGEVYLLGQECSRLPMFRRARLGMGYLPQEPSIFRRLSVRDNLLAVLETMPLSRRERKARKDELLAELDLSHLEKSKADTLSGGERRRLEISRALATDPKLLLLDEPFAGVDPIAVEEIQSIVHKLRERGIGVLITDHNVRETLISTDRAAILHQGQILREGTADELVRDPRVREVYLGHSFEVPEAPIQSDGENDGGAGHGPDDSPSEAAG